MQRYSDILDFQIACLIAYNNIWNPVDPLFENDHNVTDVILTLKDLADYYQYYEIDKVKDQSGFNGVKGYEPNKLVISLDSPSIALTFPDATYAATFNGMFFMHYPLGEEYSYLFDDFFPNFGSEAIPDYRNVLFQRGFIGEGVLELPGAVAENLVAKIMKDKQAGPIRFEPGTYRPGTGLELLPPTEDNSFYLSESTPITPTNTTPPTICYFAYLQPNYNETVLQTRTVEDASNVKVEIPVFFSQSSTPEPMNVSIHNDEGFFSQRLADFELDYPYSPNIEGYYYGYELDIGEISKSTLISDPYGCVNYYQQGVHLSAIDGGWNIVSFNLCPPATSWPIPGLVFECNSLFTGEEWSMLIWNASRRITM